MTRLRSLSRPLLPTALLLLVIALAMGLPSLADGCPDTFEPNNSFGQAIEVASGASYDSYSCSSDDLDYWKLWVNAGQTLTVDLTHMELNSDLELYDPGHSSVDQSTNAGAANERIVHTAATTGWYYAYIWWNAYGGPDLPNQYRLTMTASGGDLRVHGRVVDRDSGLGVAGATVRLDRLAGDWVFVREYTTLADGNYQWWLNPVPGDYRLVVTPPAGWTAMDADWPAEITAWLVGEDTIEFTMPEGDDAGPFAFGLDPEPTATPEPSETPTPSQTPTETPTPNQTPTPACAPDAYEPNEMYDYAPRVRLPFVETDLVICYQDLDMFLFDVKAGDVVWIVLEHDASAGDLRFTFWQDVSSTYIEAKLHPSREEITWTAPQDGRCQIVVEREPLWDTMVPYMLSIQSRRPLTPSPTWTPITPTPTHSPTPTTDARPTSDVRIWEMEVVQTIQNLDNDTPLVRGKDTFVRIHVETDGHNVGPIRGWIEATDLAGSRLAPAQVPCVNKVTVNWAQGLSVQRNDMSKALWCRVPNSWVNYIGGLQITAHVACDTINDPYPSNNTKTVGIPVVDAAPVHIVAVQVRDWVWSKWKAYGPAYSDYKEIMNYARRIYPTSSITLHPHKRWVLWTGDYLTFAGLIGADLLDRDPGPNTIIMGMVRDNDLTKWAGMGMPSGHTWVEVRPKKPELMGWAAAHEMSHGFGIYHVNACGAGWPHESYPYPTRWLSAGGVRDFYGLDPRGSGPHLFVPQMTADLMTYCGPAWISDYTNTKLRNKLLSGAGMSSMGIDLAADGEYLAVMGTIQRATDEVALLPVIRLAGADLDGSAAMNAESDWSCMLLAADDAVLAQESFDAGDSNHTEDVAPFGVIVPYAEGAAKLVIAHHGAERLSQAISEHAPTVTLDPITMPITDTLEVSWSAEDSDGDALSYTLLFSADDGDTWEPAALGITQTTAVLDTYAWPGTETGRLRILASDGFNQGEDVSASFAVPTRAPMITLIQPGDGASILAGMPIAFSASVWDAEDGPLEGDAIVWSSDMDGQLGTGEEVIQWHLLPGWRTITVSATDSDGMTSTASVDVHVGWSVALPVVRE